MISLFFQDPSPVSIMLLSFRNALNWCKRMLRPWIRVHKLEWKVTHPQRGTWPDHMATHGDRPASIKASSGSPHANKYGHASRVNDRLFCQPKIYFMAPLPSPQSFGSCDFSFSALFSPCSSKPFKILYDLCLQLFVPNGYTNLPIVALSLHSSHPNTSLPLLASHPSVSPPDHTHSCSSMSWRHRMRCPQGWGKG